jgi:hypothetical protein
MAKNFAFMVAEEADFSSTELRQGDILERNEGLAAAIGQAHQYYAQAEGYDYFIVLTPTCELVRRQGACRSRYITLAAVRPLALVIGRQLQNYKKSVKAPGLFCSLEKRARAEEFLMRLLHNTEEGYLFLPGELFPDDVDRCGFLKLSVALRADHYDARLAAKMQQLETDFSAKVGYLTADLYGQVATQALEEQVDINVAEIIANFKARTIDSEDVMWLSRARLNELKSQIKSKKAAVGGTDLNPGDVKSILDNLPNDQSLLARRIVGIVQEALRPEIDTDALLNKLASDPAIGQFIR